MRGYYVFPQYVISPKNCLREIPAKFIVFRCLSDDLLIDNHNQRSNRTFSHRPGRFACDGKSVVIFSDKFSLEQLFQDFEAVILPMIHSIDFGCSLGATQTVAVDAIHTDYKNVQKMVLSG